MSHPYSYQQRRVIMSLVRRNSQGWGKPLAFTVERVRFGALFIGVAVVCGVADIIVSGGVNGTLSFSSAANTFLGLLFVFALVLGGGVLMRALPTYLRARDKPPVTLTGTVEAVVCDAKDVFLGMREPYHFITLRLRNGTLRPFAVSAALHDQVCRIGKQVTLTVVPGTEQVTAAE